MSTRQVFIAAFCVAALAVSGCKKDQGDTLQQAEPAPPPMHETFPEPHPPVEVIPARPAAPAGNH